MTTPTIQKNFEFNGKIAANLMKASEGGGGLHEYLGFETVDMGPGTMHCRFQVRSELLTPFGNMHGGVLSAFCDHMLGMVCYPVMRKGQWAATTEFKINLTRPVTEGVVDGYATIIHMGRSQAVVRMDVHNCDRVCAMSQGTATIMDPR